MTLAIWNCVQILWNLWDIIYPEHNNDLLAWSLALFGVAAGFSDTFVTIFLPMTLADKNRVLAYELTMLGTILGIMQLMAYFSVSVLGGLILELAHEDKHISNALSRSIIICVLILSIVFLWKRAFV